METYILGKKKEIILKKAFFILMQVAHNLTYLLLDTIIFIGLRKY